MGPLAQTQPPATKPLPEQKGANKNTVGWEILTGASVDGATCSWTFVLQTGDNRGTYFLAGVTLKASPGALVPIGSCS